MNALRPLSIGEIFDRAITLYARNFVLFTILVLVAVLPFGVFEFYADKSNVQTYTQILQAAQHPGQQKKAAADAAELTPEDSAALLGAALIALLLAPASIAAAAFAVWKISLGELPGWRACFADAFGKFGELFGVSFCFGIIVFCAAFAGAFVMMIPAVVGALTYTSAPPVGVTLFVITGLLGIAWFVGVLVLSLAVAFAFCGVGVEGLGLGAAIGRAFGRIFNRREIGKAALMALAIAAVNIGLSIIAMSVELLLVWLVHSSAVDALVQTIIALIQYSFLAVLVGVYYVEARVRQEGLDVHEALDRLQPQTT